ncbi:MAG: hypothetical protein JEZ01_06210 [Labilibaculum sp.]|nr:hypothetical protein [Labilibaculum sp.]MBI9057348.1 hypothetical protein [Labilibaculum sp.]
MKKIILIGLIVFSSIGTYAQTPMWQGKGRIAISSDGNEHDHDDWAATPLTLAMLAAKGLQNKVVLYTYSDHIWWSNLRHPSSPEGMNAYEHMRESALGAKKRFGFNKSKFICAVDNPEKAYKKMAKAINASSIDDPLYIIAAGPMQVVGEAINRANPEKRQYVTVLSHSYWNNRHSDKINKGEPEHSGWTFKEMIAEFGNKKGGNVKFVKILDQNEGKDYLGLNCPKKHYDWMKTFEANNKELYKEGALDWLYSRLITCTKNKGLHYDPSDAGMAIYFLTGVEKTNPNMIKEILENPVSKIKN